MLIAVPSFSEEDLSPLLDEEDPTTRMLNRATRFLLNLLDGLNGREATAGALAWLALWSRGWQILRAAKEAMDDEQRFVLVILHRAATELDLHGQLIVEPVLQASRLRARHGARIKVSKQAQARAEEQVLERLVGYAAWCLEQDRKHLVTAKTALADVYNGADARALARDARSLAMHEALYGDLEVDNQHELDLQRERHKTLLDNEFDTHLKLV